MLVVVDRRADGGIVLVPLTSLDFTITVSVTEVSEEFQEDFVFGHLTRLDLGVHCAVVDASKVGGGNFTGAIGIEFKESLVSWR